MRKIVILPDYISEIGGSDGADLAPDSIEYRLWETCKLLHDILLGEDDIEVALITRRSAVFNGILDLTFDADEEIPQEN